MDFLNQTGAFLKPYWEQVDKEAFTQWGTAATAATGLLLGVKIVSNIYLPEPIVDLTTCGQIIIVARLIQHLIAPLIADLEKNYLSHQVAIKKAGLLLPVILAIGTTKALFQVKSWISFTLFGFILSFVVHELVEPYIVIGGEPKAS